jgi:hypothetical protein
MVLSLPCKKEGKAERAWVTRLNGEGKGKETPKVSTVFFSMIGFPRRNSAPREIRFLVTPLRVCELMP